MKILGKAFAIRSEPVRYLFFTLLLMLGVGGLGVRMAQAQGVCTTESILFQTPYTGGCYYESSDQFTLPATSYVTWVRIWYNTNDAGTGLNVVMTGPNGYSVSQATTKGGCAGVWCEGKLIINNTLQAGNYSLTFSANAVCKNPSGDSTQFVYGCAAPVQAFDVKARASGATSALTLDLDVKVASADSGKSGSVYLAAGLPTSATSVQWFFNNGSAWSSWSGGTVPAYSTAVLPSSLSLPVLRGNDVRALAGLQLYAGYGTDPSDMLARGHAKLGYVIPGGGATSPGPTVTLMTNPTDSELLSVLATDGTTVNYFGTRDAIGIAQTLNKIQFVSSDGSATWVELDVSSRPKKMRAANGSVFELLYSGTNQASVTATAGDGSAKVTTSFPLGTAVAPTASLAAAASLQRSMPLFAPAQTSDWSIQVNRCGVATDEADVYYSISVPGQVSNAGNGAAVSVGNGKYTASIPTGLKPSLTLENLRSASESIAGVLGNACDVLSFSGAGRPELYLATMCPFIGAALSTVTGPGGVAIGSACTAVSAAVLGYCAVLGESGVYHSASAAERILQGLQDPKVFTSDIGLRADVYVKGLPGAYVIGPSYAPSNGPFPAAAIEINDQCPAPALSGIVPSTGPVGTSVTISGTGFGATAGIVTFNGTKATVTSWLESKILTTVPAGAISGNVVVTANGSQSNPLVFQVTSGSAKFTANNNGTVTDNTTGLVWQQGENPRTYNWYEASGTYDINYNASTLNVCASLSLAGGSWRLPTLTELARLVVTTGQADFFPGQVTIPYNYYWTSTLGTRDPSSAYFVSYKGTYNTNQFYWLDHVRCVR
ncbi:MAG: DUF1566 domain-containing protein [Burkholderiales bacterium]